MHVSYSPSVNRLEWAATIAQELYDGIKQPILPIFEPNSRNVTTQPFVRLMQARPETVTVPLCVMLPKWGCGCRFNGKNFRIIDIAKLIGV
jgi:hypothetical protein